MAVDMEFLPPEIALATVGGLTNVFDFCTPFLPLVLTMALAGSLCISPRLNSDGALLSMDIGVGAFGVFATIDFLALTLLKAFP